jgi:hypothetical protein
MLQKRRQNDVLEAAYWRWFHTNPALCIHKRITPTAFVMHKYEYAPWWEISFADLFRLLSYFDISNRDIKKRAVFDAL